MPNNNYARGVAFERKVKAWFEDHGFLAARTAGSHGLMDVLAVTRSGQVYLVQCKTGNATLGAAERTGFARFADDYRAKAFLATPDPGKPGGINFQLIDYTGDLLEFDMERETYIG